jgi:transcriptional regulator with XRE-family HTH domain
MKGKTKSSTENQTFLERFRDLFNKKGCSQVELADAIGSYRTTVASWLDGKSAPNAYMAKALEDYFSVSADYLLCISNTRSSDVNVKAAMEYTGLTEEAVERLQGGFDYPEYYEIDIDAAEKEENRRVVSALITSHEFENMINSLAEAAKWAYLESALTNLQMQRIQADILAGKTERESIPKDELDRITSELLQILKNEGFYVPEYHLYRLEARIAECLGGDGLIGLLDIRESLDRQQFLASKAIIEYLGQLVKESRQMADRRFEVSTSKSEK